VECLKKQEYPQTNYRILILADNCDDNSAEIARSCGVEVYERQNRTKQGKGFALNELLEQRLRSEPFDLLVLFDIDARVEPLFLSRLAQHVQKGARVLQGATVSKNPNDTALTRVGDFIQSLIRLHQKGRSLLGLSPLIIGSHGMMISREGLELMHWYIATGETGDDFELGLRCSLLGIPITYASDLIVSNDLAANADELRAQRRRWSHINHELIPKYTIPCIRNALAGDWRSLEILFSFLLTPGFSVLFLLITTATLVLGVSGLYHPSIIPYGIVAGVLWILDVLYFAAGFNLSGVNLKRSDLYSILWYLSNKVIALIQSIFLIRSKRWTPSSHTPQGLSFLETESSQKDKT